MNFRIARSFGTAGLLRDVLPVRVENRRLAVKSVIAGVPLSRGPDPALASGPSSGGFFRLRR